MRRYYKLDYEDIIGDTPTRFKYQEGPKFDCGLTPEQILLMDDRDLRQIMPMSYIAAPYKPFKADKKKMQKIKAKAALLAQNLEEEDGGERGAGKHRKDGGKHHGGKRQRESQTGPDEAEVDGGKRARKEEDGGEEGGERKRKNKHAFSKDGKHRDKRDGGREGGGDTKLGNSGGIGADRLASYTAHRKEGSLEVNAQPSQEARPI